MLRAVQGWRRVTALRRASVQCVRLVVPPCRKDEGNFCRSDAEVDVRRIGVAKNFSRFELDARFKKVVFLSID